MAFMLGGYESIIKEELKKIVRSAKNDLTDEKFKATMTEMWEKEKKDIEKMSAIYGFGYGAAIWDIMDAMKLSKEAREEIIAAINEKEE